MLADTLPHVAEVLLDLLELVLDISKTGYRICQRVRTSLLGFRRVCAFIFFFLLFLDAYLAYESLTCVFTLFILDFFLSIAWECIDLVATVLIVLLDLGLNLD